MSQASSIKTGAPETAGAGSNAQGREPGSPASPGAEPTEEQLAASRRQDDRRRRIERRGGAKRRETRDHVRDIYIRAFIGLFVLTMACMLALAGYALAG